MVSKRDGWKPIPLGVAKCGFCAAQVMYKENRNGQVYFKCRGGDDPEGRACGSEAVLGNFVGAPVKASLKDQTAEKVHGPAGDTARGTDRPTGAPEPDDGAQGEPDDDARGEPDAIDRPGDRKPDRRAGFGGITVSL